MKQRQFTFWACLVATVLLLAGCLQDKVGGVRIYSEPSAEFYSIPNQTGLFLFHSSGPWKATSPEPWLQVLKESGPGGTDTLKVMTTQKSRRRTAQRDSAQPDRQRQDRSAHQPL